jgi:hypothetical protein
VVRDVRTQRLQVTEREDVLPVREARNLSSFISVGLERSLLQV